MVLRYLKWRGASIWPGTERGGVDREMVRTPTDEMEILSVSDSTEPPCNFEWIAQVDYTRGLKGHEEIAILPFDDAVLAKRVRDTLKLHNGRKVGALADVEIVD
jgi:hypothetical protein